MSSSLTQTAKFIRRKIHMPKSPFDSAQGDSCQAVRMSKSPFDSAQGDKKEVVRRKVRMSKSPFDSA
jgi:hypothetical protein